MKRVTFPNPQQSFCHMAYLNFNIFVMISTFPLQVIPYLLFHNSDFFIAEMVIQTLYVTTVTI